MSKLVFRGDYGRTLRVRGGGRGAAQRVFHRRETCPALQSIRNATNQARLKPSPGKST
jgi:hypothetical protein